MSAKIETIRHSLAHIMAYAVQELYPGAKFGIGPAIENGFYYDFELSVPLAPEDLLKIEKKMRELLAQNIVFKKQKLTRTVLVRMFKKQPYKLELLKEIKQPTIYESGTFVDLCSGPHVKSTKEITPDAFKLTKIAGAYWKGSEKNKMLTRIYGVAFAIKKELEDFLKIQEEAEKRDHRIIGKNLDLFVFSDLVGKGLPLFTEKGSIIRRELERFVVDEEIKRGYKHVYTPELAKVELYKTSGHYPYYKDSMYPVMKIDEEELILRPMTCPHHFQLYASKPRSYKELPFRIAELAKQFRYEKSGELTGLIRVRSFCLADAHIICQKEKAMDEINGVLDLIEYMALKLGLKAGVNYRYRLSLGDRKDSKKYFKDNEAWNFAEGVLRNVLTKRGKDNFFEAQKEAAFYGPKIDIQMKNFAGKEDTAFTIQYDFVMPKRFKLSYIDQDGKEKEPIVIHRSSIGAIERTMAFLLEHYAGALPLWLSPVQCMIIPIADRHNQYAEKIRDELNFLRIEINNGNETVSKRIREGELQKVPYLIVVGDKEAESGKISVRERGRGDIGAMELSKFTEKVKMEKDA
ncbi:MAG: threonine--tRNA ligase [Candidatus Nealsonbacteria bacterium]|nr:threonine--tRNA ligase [Candidatus Nealsonbacteria bacterium]